MVSALDEYSSSFPIDASMLSDDVATMLARCFGLVFTSSERISFFEPRETSTTDIDCSVANECAHAMHRDANGFEERR